MRPVQLLRQAARRMLAAAIFAGAGLAASLPARAAEWITLGEAHVDHAGGGEAIPVGRQEGEFASLRIESLGGAAFVAAIRVTYADGGRDELPVRQTIAPGREMDPIALPGGRPRLIEELSVDAGPAQGERGAVSLRILGELADYDAAPGGPVAGAPEPAPRPPVAGPPRDAGGTDQIELDSRRVDLRNERVILSVPSDERGFSAITLRAEDEEMFIRRVELTDVAGRTEEIRIGETLAPGQQTRPIEVPKALGALREVVVVLRPEGGRREARLVLSGLAAASPPPERRPERRPAIADSSIDPAVRGRLEPPPSTDRYGVPGGGFELLGNVRAQFQTGRDVVPVGRGAGVFDRIVLRVTENDLFLREFTIVYADGERDRIPVAQEIRANSLTPTVLLRGARPIREIELIHQSRPDRRGLASIEIYGERVGRDAPPPAQPPQPYPPQAAYPPPGDGGWTMLGRQRAQMFADDTDSFEVGRQHGPFSALRITARRHAVVVYGLRVVYADGSSERQPINAELRDGDSSPVIELRGTGRPIDRIVLNYRSKLNFKGEGEVEVWGLR